MSARSSKRVVSARRERPASTKGMFSCYVIVMLFLICKSVCYLLFEANISSVQCTQNGQNLAFLFVFSNNFYRSIRQSITQVQIETLIGNINVRLYMYVIELKWILIHIIMAVLWKVETFKTVNFFLSLTSICAWPSQWPKIFSIIRGD